MGYNSAQQIKEMEVLSSIFGNEWKRCPIVKNSYNISLAKDVELSIILNKSYPSEKPPQYQLCAPNFTQRQKNLVDRKFQEIYWTHKGYPIIFHWIQKLREVMNNEFTISDEEEDSTIDERVYHNWNKNQSKRKNRKQAESKDSEKLEIVHGLPITDRKSTFQGHVCRVTSTAQVKQFVETLLQNKKIVQAKHNIQAYRIVTKKDTINQDYDEDGEAHAGGRLLHLMEKLDVKNIAVVVTRWYGGIHLGADRFKHINNAAQQALISAGFIQGR